MDFTAQIVEKWGHLPHFRRVGSEWKASCPKCGESGRDRYESSQPDRFHIHAPDWKLPIPRGKCRKCGHFEAISDGKKITPVQQKELEQQRDHHQQEIAKRQKSRLAEIQDDNYWRGFHAGMEAMHREMWREHGIDDPIQDLFSLGYNPDKVYKMDGELCHSEALTIPYLRHYDGNPKPVNIAHRLLHKEGSGKYRYEYGVPAASFIVESHLPMTGHALVVEGAKKAMICWLYVGKYFDHIIGLPSADIGMKLAEELHSFDKVSLLLDPDTYEPQKGGRVIAQETARKVGIGTMLVRPSLDVKPDDLLLSYANKQLASDIFMTIIDRATKFNP